MKRKPIRLTENGLKRLVEEAAMNVIAEAIDEVFYSSGSRFVDPDKVGRIHHGKTWGSKDFQGVARIDLDKIICGVVGYDEGLRDQIVDFFESELGPDRIDEFDLLINGTVQNYWQAKTWTQPEDDSWTLNTDLEEVANEIIGLVPKLAETGLVNQEEAEAIASGICNEIDALTVYDFDIDN